MNKSSSNVFHLTLRLTCFVLLLSAAIGCGKLTESPEKDGKLIGQKYAKILEQLIDSKKDNFSELIKGKESCYKEIDDDLAKCEHKYYFDNKDCNKILTAFRKSSGEMQEKLNKIIEEHLQKAINNKIWVKVGETNRNYCLCSFTSNKLKLINSITSYSYKLISDTLIFNDSQKTKCQIKIESPDRFTLVNCKEKDLTKAFRLAQKNDLVIGQWLIPRNGNILMSFYPHGSAIAAKASDPNQSAGCSYRIDGNKIRVANNILEFDFEGNDTILLKDEVKTYKIPRLKKATSSDLRFLFL
ncbi:MAG: hypothetical protein Q8859_02795 [Bacteroidota bacterium]|nr:hypothetical protein [Bacteroidota bacterium]